jgi:competence ComEA-like helix-hairpin-helix protein
VKRIFVLALISACWLWSDDGEGQRLPPGSGKDAVATGCSKCHSVTRIREQRLSKEEWTITVSKMLERRAPVADEQEQIPVIIDYLTNNFGPDSKLRVNSAPLDEFKAILGLTVNEADAIINYRETHGDYHQLSDLEKVPNVERKKIESKKDQLEF